MKKFKDMNLCDQLLAIFYTKVQEYSLRLQYISNCNRITLLLENIFSKASKAHLKLFSGYDFDILTEKLLFVPESSRLSLLEKVLMPFFRRNAAICMKETSRYTGEKFRSDLVKVGGVVLLTKVLLKCTESEAIEYIKVAAENKNK